MLIRLISAEGYVSRKMNELRVFHFVYCSEDTRVSEFDPGPYEASINYRQPLIDWMKTLNTSENDPLSNYLDDLPRQ